MHEEHGFGRRLRAERERRRITLESVAANTKIAASLLRGLERDDVSYWPGGIFRRSFVKAYAAAVGLDPDDTLAEFLERFPEPGAPAERINEHSASAARPAAKKPVLRLTLADEPHVFTSGPVLEGMGRRLAALACDLTVPLALATITYAVAGMFWAPLALAFVCYLGVSLLILGNTPGISLCAPVNRAQPSTDAPAASDSDTDDLAALPMFGQHASR